MSGISKRENKTIYQIRREELGWSRAKASEETFISENRLEKIETLKTLPTPEDIVAMADAYNAPELCNYYCVNECAIGERLRIPMTERKSLPRIVLEVLTTLSQLEKEKDRLVEIANDEQITEDEMHDFVRIRDELEKISATADSLKLWISDAMTSGSISKEMLEKVGK